MKLRGLGQRIINRFQRPVSQAIPRETSLAKMRFANGAPVRGYYIPEIRTHLFNWHKNFAIAHALEIQKGTIPQQGNLLLMIDNHFDYQMPQAGQPVNLPLGFKGQRSVSNLELMMAENLVDEVNFTRPFLDNGNLAFQVALISPEKKPAGDFFNRYPDARQVFSIGEAIAQVVQRNYPGKLVITIDMDYFYNPVFSKEGWREADIIGRVNQVVNLLDRLKLAGHRAAYFSVATTSFNMDRLEGSAPRLAVEKATRRLLESLRMFT